MNREPIDRQQFANEAKKAQTHITYIEVDAGGTWEWNCSADGCWAEGTGYDDADEVIADAEAHGPLASNSLVPVNEEDER